MAKLSHLYTELRWAPDFAQRALDGALRAGLVVRTHGHLKLTDLGRALADRDLARDQARGDVGVSHGVPLDL